MAYSDDLSLRYGRPPQRRVKTWKVIMGSVFIILGLVALIVVFALGFPSSGKLHKYWFKNFGSWQTWVVSIIIPILGLGLLIWGIIWLIMGIRNK